MGFNPNGLTANVMVTILTLVMVFILPALDWYICRRVGVSLTDGVSTNKNADKILHIRNISSAGRLRNHVFPQRL